MMKQALLFIFLLPSLYVLEWRSPLPIQVERVEIAGGAFVQGTTARDGMSGSVAASADRECLTITIEGHTTTGIAIRIVQAWQEGCERIYVPLVGKGDD